MTGPSGSNEVFTERGPCTLARLRADFERQRLDPLRTLTCPVALVCSSAAEALGAAAGLAGSGVDGLILPLERDTAAVAEVLSTHGYAVQRPGGGVTPATTVHPRQRGRISLLTSGTTGVPKLIHHRWESLFTLRGSTAPGPRRWLLTYQAGTYAWFQMVTMALFLPGQQLVVGDRAEPVDLLELARRWRADAISSTPTFWRFAMLQVNPGTLRGQSFVQITLGGERVDQVILDQLRSLYPSARLSHIYASTEVGTAIVVHDGQEGFPAAWLRPEVAPYTGSVQLRIEDGTLRVRSPWAAADQGDWVDTGDSAEVRGGRVVIVGRVDASFINVGGLKVSAFTVEEALLRHEDVAWCRIYGRASPLTGSLVAADVVLKRPAADILEAETMLARHAGTLLPDHAVPRLWRILDSIPMTGSLKSEVA